jgi:peptidoglycan/xylan/chitin deacetylase (PgdA/CDA1 family)
VPPPDWINDRCKDLISALARPIFGGVGCILALHRVVPENQQSSLGQNRALEIGPESLRAILQWVRRRGLEVVRLDEVRNRLGEPRGPKFVCFTFDDGYRDNLELALPIFREFGAAFAVNITTGFINRTASVWWYTLEEILKSGKTVSFSWEGMQHDWRTDSTDARETAFAGIAALIRAQGTAGRDDLVNIICEPSGSDPLEQTRKLMMDWDELGELASNYYVTIGAHSVGHHVFSRLEVDELEGELIEAKAELEARLSKPVQHLAYPFGGRDAVGRREFDLARECDYVTAVTTRNGNLFRQHAWHLQSLPRLGIDGNYPPIKLLSRMESGLITARGNGWRRLVVD